MAAALQHHLFSESAAPPSRSICGRRCKLFAMTRMRRWAFQVFVWLCAGACCAIGAVRKPLGVYIHLAVSDAIGSYPGKAPSGAALHTYLQNFYAGLLTDPAIAGIAFGGKVGKTTSKPEGV